MKRCDELRVRAISAGRLSISSRWISISLSGPVLLLRANAALTPACAAFTSDDLPMPRAPQSNALLAGSRFAKRSVFSTSTSRTRSMPLSSDISTRLTRVTGASRPSGYHTKASADCRSGRAARCGTSRSSAMAMRSMTSAVIWLCPAERVPAFDFGLSRRADRDFDLAIWVFPQIALLLAGGGVAPASGHAGKWLKMAGFRG